MNPQNQQHENLSRPYSVVGVELLNRISRLNYALVVMEESTRILRQVNAEQVTAAQSTQTAAQIASREVVDLHEYQETRDNEQNPRGDQGLAQSSASNGELPSEEKIQNLLDQIYSEAASNNEMAA